MMMDPSIDNKEQNRRQQNEPEEEEDEQVVRVDSSSTTTTTTTVIDQLTSHLASTHINNNHNVSSHSHSSSSSEQSNNDDDEDDEEDNIDNFKRRIQRFAQRILNGQIKRMLLITGAGLSTAAGIPDFRTPGTGLYYNLQKYNLPNPTSIFELSYFMKNPEPFFLLSQDFLDIENRYEPTDAHYFIRLLHDKGLLLRNYTQNIDGLEFLTRTSIEAQQEETSSTAAAASSSSSSFDDVILQCHGSYRTAHCVQCNHLYTNQQVKQMMNMNNNNSSSSSRSSSKENVVVPYCTHCDKKNNIIKPDIVMFGESLPDKFEKCLKSDVEEADCVLIMGTSLTVYPVAGIPELIINKHKKKKKHSGQNDVEENARVMTHMLFNRERVGPFDPLMSTLLYDGCGVSRSSRRRMNRARDSVQHEFMFVGEPYSIDDAVNMLVDELGWREEFNAHRPPTSSSINNKKKNNTKNNSKNRCTI